MGMKGKPTEKITPMEAAIFYEDCGLAMATLQKDNGVNKMFALTFMISYCVQQITKLGETDEQRITLRNCVADTLRSSKV